MYPPHTLWRHVSTGVAERPRLRRAARLAAAEAPGAHCPRRPPVHHAHARAGGCLRPLLTFAN